MTRHQCYLLIFRHKKTHDSCEWIKDWNNPTGGVVMDVEDVKTCFPAICLMRYHCDPDEMLTIIEAVDEDDQRRALLLHNQWEKQMRWFLELMESP